MAEITNKDLFDHIENVRTELGSKIDKVDEKFTSFEAGRLSNLEKSNAKMTAEFNLVKNIVYGASGFILLSVLTALIYLVLKR